MKESYAVIVADNIMALHGLLVESKKLRNEAQRKSPRLYKTPIKISLEAHKIFEMVKNVVKLLKSSFKGKKKEKGPEMLG